MQCRSMLHGSHIITPVNNFLQAEQGDAECVDFDVFHILRKAVLDYGDANFSMMTVGKLNVTLLAVHKPHPRRL